MLAISTCATAYYVAWCFIFGFGHTDTIYLNTIMGTHNIVVLEFKIVHQSIIKTRTNCVSYICTVAES